ncbi:hypothetical protein EVAR_93428_1 [Eumeta japonica]|uniref:Uncharacterized protein n=1 Tax=Eumeta variegata TaxID=151549 RepID=A0A4C1UPT7_EUMVA|nr:hypothetical protein EVAR_93428_1 [Eumeta japonica]
MKTFLKGKSACKTSDSRWSPPTMDIHNPRGVICTLLAFWVLRRHLMEGERVLLQKKKKYDTSREKIDNVYDPNALSVRVAQNWFKRFQSSNFDDKAEPRSGRPVTDKVDAILKKVEQDRHLSSYNIAKKAGD